MRRRRQLSFRAHVIALVVAGVLPLAGLGLYSMLQLAAAERAAERSQLVGMARAVSATVEQEFRHHLTDLRALAQRFPRHGADLSGFYAECAALAGANGGWILLIDGDGRQIFNTKRPLGASLPPTRSSPELAEALATGEPRISGLITGTVDPQPQYTLFQPLIAQGRARVLAMTFPTGTLDAVLRSQNLPRDWAVSAIDRTGIVVAKPDEAAPILGQAAAPEILALSSRQGEGFVHVTHKLGVPIDMGVARSALSGWTVVVGIPSAIVGAPLRQTLWRFAVLGGALLLLALGLATVIGGQLSHAIRHLADAAGALARREPLPARSTVSEVAAVARALGEAGQALIASEGQLRRSERHLTEAQHVAGMGSIERDLRTGEVQCSDEIFRIFGVERGSFVPSLVNILALVHPDDRAKVQNDAAALRTGGKPPALEFRIIRPDGETRVLRRQAEPAEDPGGDPRSLFVTIMDITSLRAAEERQRQLEQNLLRAQEREAARLRESEARLRRSQQHLELAQRVSHTGSVLRDLKTDAGDWSDELYRILGIEPGATPPGFDAFLALLHPDDRAAVAEDEKALRRGERPPMREYRVVRPDGSMRVIDSEVEPVLDEAGQPAQLVITFHDVTELRAAEARERELERQLLHAQKLEALGTLAGGIAHDLNNTLVPVLALAKITMRRLPEGSREHANLGTILHAGERARDLVRQVLAFSRKEEPRRQPVDLGSLLRDSLGMLAASLPATVRLEHAIAAVPPISADPGQIHQVLINLVVNAAHAVGGRMGRIVVTLDTVPAPDGMSVHLAVADNGCGMDEPTRRRVFEPFFTTKEVGEGTGLGLSVAHGIVTQHGGRIMVESEPGKGTRFDVYLPALTGGDERRALETAEA